MSGEATPLVCGFPVDEDKRDELRKMHPTGRIPAVVSRSVQRPCVGCGMLLWIGPRQAGTGFPAVCPWCAFGGKVAREVVLGPDLGNPESHLEGDS